MKVICPNCKEVIDVKQDDKYGYCKHCSNQFVTSDALNLLVKQYKKINNYAKTQLFTNLNVDEAAGTNFIQSDLVLQFSRMETAKRTAIAALSLGEVCGIVLDCNGKYWALGFDEPMTTSSGVGQTGTARTDSNNYSITLTDFAKTYPYEVAKSVVDGLQIGD